MQTNQFTKTIYIFCMAENLRSSLKAKPSKIDTRPEETICHVTDIVAFEGFLPLRPLAKLFAPLSGRPWDKIESYT